MYLICLTKVHTNLTFSVKKCNPMIMSSVLSAAGRTERKTYHRVHWHNGIPVQTWPYVQFSYPNPTQPNLSMKNIP